jgi:hypothetical protein
MLQQITMMMTLTTTSTITTTTINASTMTYHEHCKIGEMVTHTDVLAFLCGVIKAAFV